MLGSHSLLCIERIADLKDQQRISKKLTSDTLTKLAATQKALDQHQTAIGQIKTQLHEEQSKTAKLSSSLAAESEKLVKIQAQFEAEKKKTKETAKLRREKQEADNKAKQAEDAKKRIQESLRRQKEQLQALQREYEAQQKASQKTIAELRTRVERLSQAEKEKEEIRIKFEQEKAASEEKDKRIAEQQAEIGRLQKEIEDTSTREMTTTQQLADQVQQLGFEKARDQGIINYLQAQIMSMDQELQQVRFAYEEEYAQTMSIVQEKDLQLQSAYEEVNVLKRIVSNLQIQLARISQNFQKENERKEKMPPKAQIELKQAKVASEEIEEIGINQQISKLEPTQPTKQDSDLISSDSGDSRSLTYSSPSPTLSTSTFSTSLSFLEVKDAAVQTDPQPVDHYSLSAGPSTRGKSRRLSPAPTGPHRALNWRFENYYEG